MSVLNGSAAPRIRAVLEWLLWTLSIYFVPLLIALVSVAALVLWEDQYAYTAGKALEFKVYTSTAGTAGPATPVTDIATDAPDRRSAPIAIASATSPHTAVFS